MDKNIFQIIKESELHAKKKGFKMNPDKVVVENLAKGLLEREKKFGYKYCPCRRITGNLKEDEKIICPCIYHIDEIKKEGHCLCWLFTVK